MAEKDSALSRFERDLAEVQLELDVASAAAETEDRSLLNASGNELVTVVARFLRELSFGVDGMDRQRTPGAYLEDLQVRTPDDPEWIALVEVKGYVGGDADASGELVRPVFQAIRPRGENLSAAPGAHLALVETPDDRLSIDVEGAERRSDLGDGRLRRSRNDHVLLAGRIRDRK